MGVARGCHAVVKREHPGVVQSEAGVDVALELAAEGMKVLLQVHVEEGQGPLAVVQQKPNPHWVHCDPDVGTPAAVQELVLVPV